MWHRGACSGLLLHRVPILGPSLLELSRDCISLGLVPCSEYFALLGIEGHSYVRDMGLVDRMAHDPGIKHQAPIPIRIGLPPPQAHALGGVWHEASVSDWIV